MRRGVPARLARLAGALVVLGLALSGCSAVAAERPTVVVTTNILGDITRNMVGDQAEVVVLMESNADPHSFGISARQAAVIENADLIVHNGGGLEEGILNHVEAAAAEGVPTVAAMDAVEPLAFTHGDDDGGGDAQDPHFWTDPARVAEAAEAIAGSVLEHVDGVDSDAVQAQTGSYVQQLGELEASMEASFAAIEPARRKLITNHHVFGYLAARFGFEVIGAVIPSGTTLASPSSADLNDLTSKIRSAGVVAIFADSSQPERLAQVLAAEAGQDIAVVPLFTESLGAEGSAGATYLDMMRANTESITQALS
ncbi:zinc ABC transporter substrate-binding protein AztC [Arthrobacter nitrophenolicus]|uniref:Zinc/manganese transport system substrate-binding protein n=2 Tax=Arthrobacter nitrophenolicus TaxID=683150 RepID=A0ACC6TD72_9MICC|nr:zinc ABC transporter substrate-binding protein AztC [Arthrobacter nitrophenolicus]ELT43380.1 periplasmic solute binding protein [Arthrobacter nitrophenolicus]